MTCHDITSRSQTQPEAAAAAAAAAAPQHQQLTVIGENKQERPETR